MNCESSDAILQTYVNPALVGSTSGNLTEPSEDEDEDGDDENDEDYVDESDLYAYKGSMYEDNSDIISNDFIKKENEIDVSLKIYLILSHFNRFLFSRMTMRTKNQTIWEKFPQK